MYYNCLLVLSTDCSLLAPFYLHMASTLRKRVNTQSRPTAICSLRTCFPTCVSLTITRMRGGQSGERREIRELTGWAAGLPENITHQKIPSLRGLWTESLSREARASALPRYGCQVRLPGLVKLLALEWCPLILTTIRAAKLQTFAQEYF